MAKGHKARPCPHHRPFVPGLALPRLPSPTTLRSRIPGRVLGELKTPLCVPPVATPSPILRTLAPIWLPHCPACRCTISRMVVALLVAADGRVSMDHCGSGSGDWMRWLQSCL